MVVVTQNDRTATVTRKSSGIMEEPAAMTDVVDLNVLASLIHHSWVAALIVSQAERCLLV